MADLGSYVTGGRALYLARRSPVSQWRRRARRAIREILETNPGADTAAILDAVDDAYPFGERAHHPYKAWLAERTILVGDLEDIPLSAEEWAVIEVAADLVESERVEEARALLDAQAPNRHARPCSTCGIGKGKPCREPSTEVSTFGFRSVGAAHNALHVTRWVERIIPHASRVQP